VAIKDKMYSPAPEVIPTEMEKNKNPTSRGSLTAVLNRTMDKAPTIPKDRRMLELMVITINAVTILTKTSKILKLLE
jgi:hypothetical protein